MISATVGKRQLGEKWNIATKNYVDVVIQYELIFPPTCTTLGLSLETDFYGQHAVVSKKPKSLSICKIGHYVTAINGISVLSLPFTDIMKMLKTSALNSSISTTVRFLDPNNRKIEFCTHEPELLNKDSFGFSQPESYILAHRSHRRQTSTEMLQREKQWHRVLHTTINCDNTEAAALKQNLSSQELLSLVCKGIPVILRRTIWPYLANVNAYKSKFPSTYFNDLLVSFDSEEYSSSVVADDIEKDLNRTFPEHSFFQNPDGRLKLRSVLRAFACHSRDIGYCQSMNFIVGMLLLILQDEQDTFWLFVVMMSKYLPRENYNAGMIGTLVDQKMFERLLEMELPEVYNKLVSVNDDDNGRKKSIGILGHYISTKWVLCAYLKTFPTETTLRVWDVLFLKGPRVLFDTAVAVLALYSEEILQTSESDEMIALVDSIGSDLHNPELLLELLSSRYEQKELVVQRRLSKSILSRLKGSTSSPPPRNKTSWEDIERLREDIRPGVEASVKKLQDIRNYEKQSRAATT